MSTTQTMTARPNQGAASETTPTNRIALAGVWCVGWIWANQGGNSFARPMPNSSRLEAMKKPLMPVNTAMVTASARKRQPEGAQTRPHGGAGRPERLVGDELPPWQHRGGCQDHDRVHGGPGADGERHEPETLTRREVELLPPPAAAVSKPT